MMHGVAQVALVAAGWQRCGHSELQSLLLGVARSGRHVECEGFPGAQEPPERVELRYFVWLCIASWSIERL